MLYCVCNHSGVLGLAALPGDCIERESIVTLAYT